MTDTYAWHKHFASTRQKILDLLLNDIAKDADQVYTIPSHDAGLNSATVLRWIIDNYPDKFKDPIDKLAYDFAFMEVVTGDGKRHTVGRRIMNWVSTALKQNYPVKHALYHKYTQRPVLEQMVQGELNV